MEQNTPSGLHQSVAAAVQQAVTEAVDVAVSAQQSGFGSDLVVRVTLDSATPVTVDLIDRVFAAAWSVDRGESNSIQLNFRDANGGIPLGDVVDEFGIGGGFGSRISVSRADLEARYGG